MNVATHKDIIVPTKYGIDHAIDIDISKNIMFKKKQMKNSARSLRSLAIVIYKYF